MFLGKLVRVRIAEVLPIKKIIATPIQKILPLPRTWKGKDFCFLVRVVSAIIHWSLEFYLECLQG